MSIKTFPELKISEIPRKLKIIEHNIKKTTYKLNFISTFQKQIKQPNFPKIK
jgi:hypothetical protein